MFAELFFLGVGFFFFKTALATQRDRTMHWVDAWVKTGQEPSFSQSDLETVPPSSLGPLEGGTWCKWARSLPACTAARPAMLPHAVASLSCLLGLYLSKSQEFSYSFLPSLSKLNACWVPSNIWTSKGCRKIQNYSSVLNRIYSLTSEAKTA